MGDETLDSVLDEWIAALKQLAIDVQRTAAAIRAIRAPLESVGDAVAVNHTVGGSPVYQVTMRLPSSPSTVAPNSAQKEQSYRRHTHICDGFASLRDLPLGGIITVLPDTHRWGKVDTAHYVQLHDYGGRRWSVEFTFPDMYPDVKPSIRIHPARGNDGVPFYPGVDPNTCCLSADASCFFIRPYNLREILVELLNLSAQPLQLAAPSFGTHEPSTLTRFAERQYEDVRRNCPNGVSVALPDDRKAWGAQHCIRLLDYHGIRWRVRFERYTDAVEEPVVKLYYDGDDAKTIWAAHTPIHPLVHKYSNVVEFRGRLSGPYLMRKVLLTILNLSFPLLTPAEEDLAAADSYLDEVLKQE
jgi:ubiquitin-protein ligase